MLQTQVARVAETTGRCRDMTGLSDLGVRAPFAVAATDPTERLMPASFCPTAFLLFEEISLQGNRMREFDGAYAQRILTNCFHAILDASVQDGQVRLSTSEIYDGVIGAMAMIHSYHGSPPSREVTAFLSEVIASTFREKTEEIVSGRVGPCVAPASGKAN